MARAANRSLAPFDGLDPTVQGQLPVERGRPSVVDVQKGGEARSELYEAEQLVEHRSHPTAVTVTRRSLVCRTEGDGAFHVVFARAVVDDPHLQRRRDRVCHAGDRAVVDEVPRLETGLAHLP